MTKRPNCGKEPKTGSIAIVFHAITKVNSQCDWDGIRKDPQWLGPEKSDVSGTAR